MNKSRSPRTTRRGRIAMLAGCLSLGVGGHLLAAPTLEAASRQKVAQQCVADLQAFHDELQKGGYWLSSSGYGGGYPRYGYVYGERGMMLPIDTFESKAEVHARPGYEIRTLMASAHIMAQRGQQAACEALLAETRDIYKDYAANLNKTGVAKADMSGWQNQLIAAAQPVTSSTASFRSDQLIGAAVVTPHNDSLGSVDDIVLSPLTGKISYLVIGHGGLFGIDEKYVPVPWEDFKMTPGATLLVLDSDKNALDAGPQVRENQFSANGDFAQESRKVDDYWKAHLAP
jgi:sporulation protein YlmC with PRC-barrel domain